MMGSLLMALLLLPFLATTVHAALDLDGKCNKTALRQPQDIDWYKVQGRWYIHSQSIKNDDKLLHYIDLEFKASGNHPIHYKDTYAEKSKTCISLDRSFKKKSQNHLFSLYRSPYVNTTTDVYISDADFYCYSTMVVFYEVHSTDGSAYDFVALLVRNPKADPDTEVKDRLEKELCQGETLANWKQPANNIMCYACPYL